DRAGDRPPLRRRLDVLVAVEVDDAVAVEDGELHSSAASLEMSATLFIGCSRSVRSFRRLLRTAGSSAFTSTLSKNVSTSVRSWATAVSEPLKSPALKRSLTFVTTALRELCSFVS